MSADCLCQIGTRAAICKTVAEEKDKPAFDEQPLAKLLEAAYVLQEHNRELKKRELNLELQRNQLQAQQQAAPSPQPSREPASQGDYTLTLAQIVQTQHEIQATQLELEKAMTLVAQRVVEIARGSGAAIGILAGKIVQYRAVAGEMTLPAGAEVPMDKALCVASLRTGQVVRCADVNAEFLLDIEECQRRGIQSLIAVPIYRDEIVAGGLELYFATTQAFTEQDVHTCQLMAGLVTEVLARDQEIAVKKSLATERAVMLEALEKLKPNLAALADSQEAKAIVAKITNATQTSSPTSPCRKCGHPMMAAEQFCGECGTPRSSDYEPPSMQSKVASLWQMQEAMKKSGGSDDHAPSNSKLSELGPEKPLADSIEEEMPELFAPLESPLDPSLDHFKDPFDGPAMSHLGTEPTITAPDEAAASEESNESKAGEVPNTTTALATTSHTWSSAVSARDFLEQLAGGKRASALTHFWNARRGDIFLAIAVILVAVVIRWGIWSSHPVAATGNPGATGTTHRKVDPTADLSWFDRMLVRFGLAEAPPVPEYHGNPDTQVWVDLHTALYYCPPDDLYGKTPKGKYTTQRDARLDQFEPAYRKACD